MLFEAITAAGVRAIISAGWAGLGKGREDTDPNILIWSSTSPVIPANARGRPARMALRRQSRVGRHAPRRGRHDRLRSPTRSAHDHCPLFWGSKVLGRGGPSRRRRSGADTVQDHLVRGFCSGANGHPNGSDEHRGGGAGREDTERKGGCGRCLELSSAPAVARYALRRGSSSGRDAVLSSTDAAPFCRSGGYPPGAGQDPVARVGSLS